ncbi:PucR family transcriptional regulator [Scopulibacillus cellulosilyticus]|uniref:PucR family transcriptional regulator n=1 Tax=Scopulibacillus cellulosilyticus TaxID=2665665 RepID=A0ABW2Q0W2_9BACL
MLFTVENALNIQSLNGCRVVAGHRGLDRNVRSVSIMDCPDTSWLKRGDLLLTTGYVFKDDSDAQIKLIKDLAERDCAGLAIKVKRFLSFVPEPMLNEANRLGLPIIEIPYELVLSDMLFVITREILNKEKLFNNQEGRKDYFSRLLGGELTNEDLILSQGKEYGLLPNCEFASLYVLVNSGEAGKSQQINDSVFRRVTSEVEAALNVKIIGEKLDDYVIILQYSKSKYIDGSLSQQAKKAAGLLVNKLTSYEPHKKIMIGIGTVQQNASGIPKSFQEAMEAIYLGGRVNSEQDSAVYEYAGLAPEALLQHLPDHILKRYLTVTVEPLRQYDKENGTELLRTLEVYLNCGGKLGEAARILFVHRNTVKFRIARIEELLDTKLDDGMAAFRLHLGLCVGRLLGTGVSSETAEPVVWDFKQG